tara:strand:- start:7 stop:681 length:675 start_codon:yes stop_codon:yes gene_type:complete
MFFGNLRRTIQRKDVPKGRLDEIAEQVLRQPRVTDRDLQRLDRVSKTVLGGKANERFSRQMRDLLGKPSGGTLTAPFGGSSGMIRQMLPRAGLAGLITAGGLTAYDMTKDAIANNPDFIKDVGRMVARGRLAFEEGLDQAKQYGAEAVELFMDGYRDGMESKTSSMELTEDPRFLMENKRDLMGEEGRTMSNAEIEEVMTRMTPMQKSKLAQQRGSGLESLGMQ